MADRDELQLQAAIERLRDAGASRADAARFRSIEALARRLPGQPERVRQLLLGKLQAAVDELGTGHSATPAKATPARRGRALAPPTAACTPLLQLNAYIHGLRPASPIAATLGDGPDPHELASVRHFRKAWSSTRTQDQLEQAVSRKPVNAGPLNSHSLVLQSLAWMGELSTDYLQHFLAHVETLQWLERAGEAARVQPSRPARAAKATGKTAAKPDRRSPRKSR